MRRQGGYNVPNMIRRTSSPGWRPAAFAAVLALLGGVLPGCTAVPGRRSLPRATAGSGGRAADAIQRRLDDLVRKDGFPAALAAVRDRDGRVRHYTAGVADLRTRSRVPVDGQVRIGSNTKSFTSIVILQLVGEGRIGLDKPVETYLPGLLRGPGIDGRRITVRNLLQHTSGLPEYTAFLDARGVLPVQHVYFEPRALLDLALRQKAHFAPGARFEYSNTNYIVAGLIIEKVTGRPVIEEITDRVIKQAGLRHTYFPNVGDQTLHEAHPHGYAAAPTAPGKPGPVLHDVTVMDPSWGWSAGQIVSTLDDLIQYLGAVLGGRLLKPAQMKELRTVVRESGGKPGSGYGLGLGRLPLPCGGVAWGHSGGISGFSTGNYAAGNGRAIAFAATAEPIGGSPDRDLNSLILAALCP